MSEYQPKVYRDNGGDRQVIASGGAIKVETGGEIQPNSGTQASHIADPTNEATNVIAIKAILVVLESLGMTATS